MFWCVLQRQAWNQEDSGSLLQTVAGSVELHHEAGFQTDDFVDSGVLHQTGFQAGLLY